MVTPIHRFQTVDCSRPHFHRQQQSQQQQHQSQTNPSIPGAHHSSTQSQQSTAHQHQPPQLQHQSQTNQQHHHHHPHHPHHNQASAQQQSQASNLQQQQVHQVQLHISVHQHNRLELKSRESAMLYSKHNRTWDTMHNCCRHISNVGTGLEVLIFCAFSATFFLAACTVSLWRRPRDIQISGNNVISETISNAEQSSLQNPEFLSSNPSPLLNGTAGSGPLGGLVPGNIQQASLASIVAPPPPYHIAILLPDNSKDAEETPPPSYDKIII
uniref:Uncharacterized protein n=1 Tax=Anopheles coluzzii TaxID=1518534 RepID=A0A8W7Q0I6_ANOCL